MNLCGSLKAHASRSCCTIQRASGFRVTLKCRILRRSWPMTKKQYRTPKVSVGTVKKSIAAIASRWLLRNVSHRFIGSGFLGARRNPSRDTPFREIETQLEQLAMNARRSPSWILSNHTEDQGANLFADTLPSSYLADSGDPRPIQAKSRSVPVHDGSRSDQDERLPPPGPAHSQRNPEQFVQGSQSTARSLRVQCQQLPTEGQVFEDEVRPATERTDQPAEEMSERHDHGKNFSGKDRIELCAKSLISLVYDLLARHSHPCRVFSASYEQMLCCYGNQQP